MNGQFNPLPTLGHTIVSSPPHYSPSHLQHNPPHNLVATEHFTMVPGPMDRLQPTGSFHTNFGGQTTLPMFKIGQ